MIWDRGEDIGVMTESWLGDWWHGSGLSGWDECRAGRHCYIHHLPMC